MARLHIDGGGYYTYKHLKLTERKVRRSKMPCDFRILMIGKVNAAIKGKKVISDGNSTATIVGNKITITNNQEDKLLGRMQVNDFISKLQTGGIQVSSLQEETHKEELVVREYN